MPTVREVEPVRSASARLRRGPDRSRRTAALLVVLLVASLLALVPSLARADDWGPREADGPQIKLTPDGDPDGIDTTSTPTATVQGRFYAEGPVYIYLCKAGGPVSSTACDLLDTALASGLLGEFTVEINWNDRVGSAAGPCAYREAGVPCVVVAAQFGTPAPTGEPTRKGQHDVFFKNTGTTTTTSLVPRPTTTTLPRLPTTTTTTTTIPTVVEPTPECRPREDWVQTAPLGKGQDPTNDAGASPEQSGDLVWVERPEVGAPPPRQGHAMAYLPPAPGSLPGPRVGVADGAQSGRLGQTVMFGGFRADAAPQGDEPRCGAALGDTWIWDGLTWKQALNTDGQPVAGPPARYGHAMAYDGVGIVLFGGYDGVRDLGDTWTWDGTRWTRHCENGVSSDTCETESLGGDARAPSMRARTAMAYNPANPANPGDDRAVLFGGSHILDGQEEMLGDTWSWNGTTKNWTEHVPPSSPNPRAYHHMAYRPASGVVLQGGYDGNHPGPNGYFNEGVLQGSFTWDGKTWTTRSHGPLARNKAMAYHPPTDLVVLQGGAGQNAVWDGRGWTDSPFGLNAERSVFSLTPQIARPQRPFPERQYPAMAEDALGNLVFFGGYGWLGQGPNYGELDQTWTLMMAGAATEAGEKVTLEVNPTEIEADGQKTADVTFTVTVAGIPQEGYEVELSTDGDATFVENKGFTYIKGGFTNVHGKYTTPIKASRTPGLETITAKYQRPARLKQLELGAVEPYLWVLGAVGVVVPGGGWGEGAVRRLLPLPPPEPLSATLAENGIRLTLDPVAIHADGKSTSVATTQLYKGGVTDEKVCFETDGHVTFGTPHDNDCVTKTGSGNTWKMTINSSMTPGVEAITATGAVSGLSATADLYVGMGTWVDRTEDGPNPDPGRENASVAYDEASGATVLFGGYHGNHHRTSRLAEESNPPARGCEQNVDPPRDCPPTPAMLAGDTWIWDGSAWTKAVDPNWKLGEVNYHTWRSYQDPTPERPLVNSPTPREGAAMAYDASSGKLVLFGGHDGTDYLADTWTFDAKDRTWTRHCENGLSPNNSCDSLGGDITPGPSKRYVANMASDGTGVVLFAGTDGWGYTMHGATAANKPGRLRDTWIWRHGAWTSVTPPPPPPPPPAPTRTNTFSNNKAPIVVPLRPIDKGCPLACEPDKADPYPSSIPVSGLTGRVADVNVTLHDLSWTKDDPADADIMVVAPGGQSVIVMSDACGDELDLDEDNSVPDRPVPNEPGKTLTLTFDDSAGKDLSADGPCTSGTYRPANPKRATTNPCTPGHKEDFFPAPARRQGGSSLAELNAGVHANGTWSLYVVDDCPNTPHPTDLAGQIAGGWSIEITTTDAPVSPPPRAATSPPGRGRAAMAYHPPTGKVVMYGGTLEHQANFVPFIRPWATTAGSPFRPLGDTWTWDPKAMTWAQEGTGTHPGERRSAAMSYHPRTGNLMLFGGASETFGRVADPDARPECNASFCFSHEKFSGGRWAWLNDTWSWDGNAWSAQPSPSRPPGRFPAGMALDAAGRLVLVAVGEETDARGSFGPASTWTWDSTVTLRLSAQSISADGASTSVATARVNDAEGNGVAGLKAVFTTSGDVGLSAVTDHGDGTYSVTITASTSGEIETLTVRTPLGTASSSLYEVAAASGPCDVSGEPGTWTRVQDLPVPAREALAAAPGDDGRLYVFGGTDGGGRYGTNTVFNLVQSYDPCTNSWQTLPQMPGGARKAAGAAAGADGSIYLVGGIRYDSVSMDLAEVYTPGSGSTPGRWQTLEIMPSAKTAPGVAVEPSGNVYATGGHQIEQGVRKTSERVSVYSPRTGLWTDAPDMSSARSDHGAALGPDGRVFAIGGGSYGGAAPPAGEGGRSVEAHIPATVGWEPRRSLSVPRFSVGVASGPDSLIYAAGGATTEVGVDRTETVEAYAACIDTWTEVTPMSWRRQGHAVAAGPDGRIYALGGYTQKSGPYDPQGLAALNPQVTTPIEAYTVNPVGSPCPKVSVQGSEVQESRTTPAKVKFTISLDQPLPDQVIVDYKTRDRTAHKATDYVETSGQVIFAPFDITPKEVFVTVNPDAVAEKTEHFELFLSSSTDGSLVTFVNNPAFGTILDGGVQGGPEPTPPSLRIAPMGPVYESFNPTTGHFKVTMSKASSEPVSFHYAATDGSAKAGSDYEAAPGTITIEPGEISKDIPVTVLPDGVEEQPERFTMTISNAVGATIAVAEAEGTILDAAPGLSIGDRSVWEGNSQVVPATFQIVLGDPVDQPVSVEWATSDDSAVGWKDYNPIKGKVEFLPGEHEKFVTVGVLGDHVPELKEHYAVTLSKPVGEKIASGKGTGTILDDDGPTPNPDPSPPPPPALAVIAPPPLPPPAPVAQAQPQVQTQAQTQAQQQAQQQAQSQAQQQAQSQGQSQAQAQSQTQGQTQAQSQVQGQVGMTDERQRERQVEQARISGSGGASGSGSGSGTHLATGLSQPSPLAPAAWFGGMVAIGLAIAFAQQGSSPQRAPTPARSPTGGRSSQGTARLPTERIRGRHRRV